MLKKLCYFVCLCIVVSDVNAVPNCPTAEGTTEQDCIAVLGCWWDQTGGCLYCTTNEYYDTNTKTCKSCPDSHPKSEAGSTTGTSACYTTCENQPITGGQRVATSNKAYYNNSCTYTTTCNPTGNSTCSNLGFHLDGESCISNVQSCENNGYKFYTNNTWSDCYVSSCASDETLISKETCGTTPYGICKPKGIDCNSALAQTAGLDTAKCSGTISGAAQLSGTTYDFSSCTCQKGQAVSTINGTPINGTAIETCHFSSDGNSLSTTCSRELQTCNVGYCNQSGQTCVSVPAGSYSVGTEKDCHACPAGATSAAGSTAKTACHYTSTTTFADSVGNFTLPASGNIEIKWNWQ